VEHLELAQAALTAFSLLSEKLSRITNNQYGLTLILHDDGSGCIKELETEQTCLEFRNLADLLHQVHLKI